MGYQSTFDIRAKLHKLPRGIQSAKLSMPALLEDLKALEPNESFSVSGNDGIVSVGEAYWYECEEHMKKLSELYSGVLFTVVVHGEEPGDTSCTYYFDGKSQKAQITYTPFDESQLQ